MQLTSVICPVIITFLHRDTDMDMDMDMDNWVDIVDTVGMDNTLPENKITKIETMPVLIFHNNFH